MLDGTPVPDILPVMTDLKHSLMSDVSDTIFSPIYKYKVILNAIERFPQYGAHN